MTTCLLCGTLIVPGWSLQTLNFFWLTTELHNLNTYSNTSVGCCVHYQGEVYIYSQYPTLTVLVYNSIPEVARICLYGSLVIFNFKVHLKIQNTLIEHTPILKYFNRTIISDNQWSIQNVTLCSSFRQTQRSHKWCIKVV